MSRKIAPLMVFGCLCLAWSPHTDSERPKPKPEAAGKDTTALEDINFATGSSLVQDGYATLKVLANLVSRGAWIRLRGHTDGIGSKEYNLELSRQRAAAVRQKVLALVDDPEAAKERIAVEWLGETSPTGDNATRDGRWVNRRVEVNMSEGCTPSGKIGDLLEPYLQTNQVHFLIATVPDPLESNVSREFDLVLASLIRAFELHDFQRRNAWLPWSKKDDSGDEKDGSAVEEPGEPERTPGVMFFQREASLVEAVLLVGESPVWGVRRAALSQALDIAHACTPKTEPLRLLGPTFSGSADSLHSTLETWDRSVRRDFKVISGSATNPELRKLSKPGLEVKLQSTDDQVKSDRLFKHLSRLGISRLALLIESSSYGASFQRPQAKEGAKVELVLPFPMHIYAIRSAHARDREQSDHDHKDHPRPKNGNSKLKVDLAETEEARAGLNLFDPHLTSSTYDLVLSRIFDTLVRSRVEAVGIVATDIKDRLFLADAVSRFAPNLRLFTFEADELLTHPDYARATRGMLVASSHDMSLTWKLADDSRAKLVTRFGNDTSQGVFEAVVKILRESVLKGEKDLPETDKGACHPFGSGNDEASGIGSSGISDAVRISAVGREGLHLETARLFTPDRFHCWFCKWEIPRGSILVWLLMTALLVGLAVWNASIRSPAAEAGEVGWRRCGAMLSNVLSYRESQDDERRRRLYRFQAMGLSLLGLVGLAYTVLGAPVLARLFAAETNWRVITTAAVMLTTAVMVVLFLSRDLARLLAGSREPANGDEAARPDSAKAAKRTEWSKLSLFLTPLLIAASYAGMGSIAYQESDRALDLASGISPTLPLLLLLGVPGLWVGVDILRCKAFEDRLLPLLEENPGAERLAAARYRLTPNLSGLARVEFIYLTLSILILPGLFLLFYFEEPWPARLVRGIELKGSYDLGISLVLVVAVGLVLEASYRYYRAWRKLRRTSRAWIEERATAVFFQPQGETNHSRAKPIVDVLVEQIRWLMLFATLALVLVLVALLTYPFEPDRVLALYVSVLILACAVTAAVVNWQMERDPGLNEIRGSERAFTLQRVGRVAFYLGVPAAGLLAGRFPGTLDVLMGWLEPVFKVFG